MNAAKKIFHHVKQFPEPVQCEVLDIVLSLHHRSAVHTNITENERRKILREVMLRLQESRVFSEIENPVMWQRDIRRDRHLPG